MIERPRPLRVVVLQQHGGFGVDERERRRVRVRRARRRRSHRPFLKLDARRDSRRPAPALLFAFIERRRRVRTHLCQVPPPDHPFLWTQTEVPAVHAEVFERFVVVVVVVRVLLVADSFLIQHIRKAQSGIQSLHRPIDLPRWLHRRPLRLVLGDFHSLGLYRRGRLRRRRRRRGSILPEVPMRHSSRLRLRFRRGGLRHGTRGRPPRFHVRPRRLVVVQSVQSVQSVLGSPPRHRGGSRRRRHRALLRRAPQRPPPQRVRERGLLHVPVARPPRGRLLHTSPSWLRPLVTSERFRRDDPARVPL